MTLACGGQVPSFISQVRRRSERMEESVCSVDRGATIVSLARMFMSLSNSIMCKNKQYRDRLQVEHPSGDDLAVVTAIIELSRGNSIFEENGATEFAKYLCIL